MAINATWHKSHPMPMNSTLDQRVKWHVELVSVHAVQFLQLF